jgi:tether containing UBX domain for GLUT4
MPYNETDYLPTVDHAKLHQRRLAEAGRPGRLASDSELAAQEAALRERLAKVAEIEVKVRFPDQSQVVSKFGKDDNASGLYTFVRGCLDESLANEPFSLSLFGGLARGKVVIPDSADTRLIRDLRMDGRVLVNFTWEGNAALGARSSGTAVLKADLRRAAKQIKVEDVAATAVEEDEEEKKSWLRRMAGDSERGGSARDGGGKKVPKWLKLPGKK